MPLQASLIRQVDSESEHKIEPEKKKTQLVVLQIEKIPQQVAMDQQGLLIGSPILQEKLPLKPYLI